MFEVTIKTTQKTVKMLAEFPGQFKSAFFEGFSYSVKFIETQIKRSFGRRGKPKVRSDKLRISIKSTVRHGERSLKGIFSSNLVYASILETGGIIRAKRGPYLHFKIADGWVKVKQVTIPPLPYMEPGIVDNLREVEAIITNTIAKRVG